MWPYFLFRAAVVLWFKFFNLLRLSFLLNPKFAIITLKIITKQTWCVVFCQLTRKWVLRNLTGQIFTIFYYWRFFKPYGIFVHKRRDIFCSKFCSILTVVVKILYFHTLKKISARSSMMDRSTRLGFLTSRKNLCQCLKKIIMFFWH